MMSVKSTIRKYPIASFLVINYLVSWSFLYPSYQIILENERITPLSLIGLIGAYGPSIAAILVQYFLDKNALKNLLRKLIQVKASFRIIVFVILAPLLFYALSYFISLNYFGSNVEMNFILVISNLPFWFLAALPFGPMGEELGWRGFMLPKLLERYSIFKSTFLVGMAWGVWHFASFTFPGAALPGFLDVSWWTILLYFFNTISLSFIFTFVYLKTNGSVFYAILLHAFFNAASNFSLDLMGESEHYSLLLTAYILNMLLAILCGIILLSKQNQKMSK